MPFPVMKEDQGSGEEGDDHDHDDDEEKEDKKAKAGGKRPSMPTSKIRELGHWVKTSSQGF